MIGLVGVSLIERKAVRFSGIEISDIYRFCIGYSTFITLACMLDPMLNLGKYMEAKGERWSSRQFTKSIHLRQIIFPTIKTRY